MAMSAASIDAEHLRRTLDELEYREPMTIESAPLIHHILSDMRQLSQQHSDLLQHYDELFARWKRAEGSTPQLSSLALDTSLLASTLDESFMLQAVEEARARIEALQTERKTLTEEKETMTRELQRAHMASQELSTLLQTKERQIETITAQYESLLKNQQSIKEAPSLEGQIRAAAQAAVLLLPIDLQPSYQAKTASEGGEALLTTLQQMLVRVRRESEQQVRRMSDLDTMAEQLRQEQTTSQTTLAQMKGGIAEYQSQIAELNARLQQHDFERSLQADLASQIAALEGVNRLLASKVAILERLKQESQFAVGAGRGSDFENGGAGQVTQMTVQALLESLSAELSTEACFTSHLNQLVDKLNGRRVEQDRQIAQANQRIRDGELQIARLEAERAELGGRLERTLAELARKDGNASCANEAVSSMQQLLEERQGKIEEHRKQCLELKNALDSCHASMAKMRKNEEQIRAHVDRQDEEIRGLRTQQDRLSTERSRLMQQCQELQNELASLKSTHGESSKELQRLSIDLRAALAAQEKLSLELRTAKSETADLEEALAGRRREKDLLMTTYCRAIKENERLHGEMQRLQEELLVARAGDDQTDAALKAMQVRCEAWTHQVERLRGQLSLAEGRITEGDTKLAEANRAKTHLEEELAVTSRQASSLRDVIASLERSKKDLAAQMARFGQQAADLRTHLRKMEEERNTLQLQLRSLSTDNNPSIKLLQSQLANMTKQLEQVQSQIRTLEHERETLLHQMEREKLRAEKCEQMMMQERNKRIEKEIVVQSLENSRAKLKEQVDLLNGEHERSLQAMKRQMLEVREENERLKAARQATAAAVAITTDRNNSMRRAREVAPSPPRSIEDSPILSKPSKKSPNTADRLKAENREIRKQLIEARQEIRAGLSDELMALGSSLENLNSEDQQQQEQSPTTSTSKDQSPITTASSSDDRQQLMSTSERMRKKLEEENRMLMKIVEKVKKDLMQGALSSSPLSPLSTS